MANIKKLIETLDWLIDSTGFNQLNRVTKDELTEIKERLEQQAQPDEELVDKILTLGVEYYRYPHLRSSAREKICKLLQGNRSQQPEKPTVTREEIEELIIEWMALLRPDKMYDILRNFFRSKGFEVKK